MNDLVSVWTPGLFPGPAFRSAMPPIVAAVVLLLAYFTVVLRKYVSMASNMVEHHTPWGENGGSERTSLEGEEVRFRAADGHPIEGVIVSGNPDLPKMGLVVFAHEYGSVGSNCLRYCKPLLQAGYDVFSFDFRGHGASPPEDGYRPRQWPSDREQADMLGAIAFIGSWLEEQGRPKAVGVFGISRGAGAAVLASAGSGSVRAIVTDGAFSSDTTVEYLMKRFATIFAPIRVVTENYPPMVWRFLRWLLFRECQRRFRCRYPSVRKAAVRLGSKPVLLIHGEKDGVPTSQSEALYELLRGPKWLWIVPGAKHNQSVVVKPNEYARRVLAFFDEHLAVRPAPAPVRPRVFRAPPTTSSRNYVKT